MQRFDLTSPEFPGNGIIPEKHTGFGEDISPPFKLEDVPPETVSIAIVMDDLDVPIKGEFTHWIIWNIPPAPYIPEGIPGGRRIHTPVSAVQGKAWGKNKYRGPKQPPFIRKAHRYRFTAFALDTMLDISPGSNKKQLLQAMSGHVVDKADLTGIYTTRSPLFSAKPD